MSQETGAAGGEREKWPRNAPGEMRLARSFTVQIATPRITLGPVMALPNGGTYNETRNETKVPPGFTPIWGGAAAVKVEAMDRDRAGIVIDPATLAELLTHEGPLPPDGWTESTIKR